MARSSENRMEMKGQGKKEKLEMSCIVNYWACVEGQTDLGF